MKRVKGRTRTAVELAEARRERAQIEEWRRQSEEMAPRPRPEPRHRMGRSGLALLAALAAMGGDR